LANALAWQETAADPLPLIDVTALRHGNRKQIEDVAEAIGEASRGVGFFRICGHGIDRALIEETYSAAEQFFALSEEQKLECYIAKSSNHRGYVPFTEKGDYPDEVNRNYEAFDLGLDLPANDPDYLSGNRLLGPNVWPDMPGFQKTVATYYARISQLGLQVCSALEIYLGLRPGEMTQHMNKPVSQLRLLHYVRDANVLNTKSVNMGAHTDYECLTLLHTRNQGLQVMTQEDQWIDVPVDPDVFVVNIGDMLEAWTNGMLRSTPHRVLNTSPERFSLPYFLAANYDAVIEPFPQLVGDGNEAQYEPITAGGHLLRMLVRDFPYLKAMAGQQGSSAPTHNPFERRMNGVTD
jgi:isopenicillin N synthase-like dioxygenase